MGSGGEDEAVFVDPWWFGGIDLHAETGYGAALAELELGAEFSCEVDFIGIAKSKCYSEFEGIGFLNFSTRGDDAVFADPE